MMVKLEDAKVPEYNTAPVPPRQPEQKVEGPAPRPPVTSFKLLPPAKMIEEMTKGEICGKCGVEDSTCMPNGLCDVCGAVWQGVVVDKVAEAKEAVVVAKDDDYDDEDEDDEEEGDQLCLNIILAAEEFLKDLLACRAAGKLGHDMTQRCRNILLDIDLWVEEFTDVVREPRDGR
jgi:hypothetical protein